MRKSTLLILSLVYVLCGQAQYVDWLQSAGNEQMQRAWDLETDHQGNAVFCGDFVDLVKIGSQTVSSNGLADLFVASVTPDGNCNWLYSFGGGASDLATDVAVDDLGNVYVGGYFNDTIVFMGEEFIAPKWGAYVIKLDPNGNPLWIHHPTCTNDAIVHGLDCSNGKVYYTGWYSDSLEVSSEHKIYGYGSNDIMVCCLDTDGNVEWARGFGSPEVDNGYKLKADAAGNSYITGVTNPGAEFDELTIEHPGSIVLKVDPDGQAVNVRNDIHSVGLFNLAVRDDGTVAFGGYFNETIQVDSENFTAFGDTKDALFMTLNPDFSFGILKHYSGDGDSKPRIPAFDQYGNVYFLGSYSGQFIIENHELNAQMSDLFIVKFHQSGDYAWHNHSVGENLSLGYGLGVSSDDNLFFCGFHKGAISFNGNQVNSSGVADMNLFLGHSAGIDNVEKAERQEISCYPNPARDYINIRLNDIQEQHIKMRILDVNGRIHKVETSIESGLMRVDTQGIPAGVYIVEIEAGSKIFHQSIVIR